MSDMKIKTKSKLLSILLPERCPYCGAVIKPNETACVYCLENLPNENLQKSILGIYRLTGAVYYEGKYKNAILGIKSGEGLQFAYQLGALMCEKLRENVAETDFDVITFVPMHKDDLMKKGFNHSEVLAKAISEILDIPCEALLKKTKINSPQHKLPAHKRAKNVEGVYKAINKSLVKGRKILVVDDIITTGHTLSECARVLKEKEADNIHFLTFAVSIPKNDLK